MDELKRKYKELNRRIAWTNNKLNILEEKIKSPLNRSKHIKIFNRILTYRNDCHILSRKIQLAQTKGIKEKEYDSLIGRCNILIDNELSLLKSYLSSVKE